ncbi:Gfo/Idh/MocA family protein [Paenibacillus gansuensis]|uniref:Gfo/Idh/MocA family protein n=1 Tax=Paenibacillus gansuensis TaxID=306542 RepID=A0ABW5PL96_9BACL
MKQVNIGLIGLGGMARWHIHQFEEVEALRIAAICDVSPQALEETGEKLGIAPEKRYSDFAQLIADAEIDGIVSVTPNNTHAEILKACILAGKPLYAEKPLTRTYEEAVEVVSLYRQSPIPCMINFSYRNAPGFQRAKRMMEEGKLGAVRHISVQYMQEWGAVPFETPYVWRFDESVTGTGTLGDLGSHMIDLAQYVTGSSIEGLQAMLRTLIPQRPHLETKEPVEVKVDDFACFNASFDNGAVGVFQTSRNAIGCGNQHEITVYGDLGTVYVSTLNDHELTWTSMKEDVKGTLTEVIDVPSEEGLHPWRAFASLIRGEEIQGYASLEDGFLNQLVLEAVVRSHESRAWIDIASLLPRPVAVSE